MYANVTSLDTAARLLIATEAMSSCMGWGLYQKLKPRIGPLTSVVYHITGADNNPLPVRGRTVQMEGKWGENICICLASFLVMGELGAPGIMGMEIL